MEGGIQRNINRNLPMENRMVTSSMTSVTSRVPVLFRTDYVLTRYFQK